ncbi:TPA: hypothetical protein DEP96_03390 [Candidatus Uhrbacteria bacterium]|nr:hypothetical protein [Candidatus Uhrbacteria bacterium]
MSDEVTEKLGVNLLNPEVPGNVEVQETPSVELGEELGQESGEQMQTEEAPAEERAPSTQPIPQVVAAPPVAPAQDDLLKGVEDILSKGIADIYKDLAPEKKPAFRAKGEEVAQKIRNMIARGKLKVHTILKLIKEWLHSIPGINRFFLEQEAKIKTDLIIAFGESKSHHGMNAI